ncbi:MAG TPA: alanine racemase [Coriobacteriia bacterium]
MAYERLAWVEVDLDAVARNVRTLKGLTAAGTLFMAVVKADAYGHGAVRVARAAMGAGADRLGVATVDEAVELREAGLASPVHILSEPPASAAALIVEHDLVPALYSLEFARALSQAATAAGAIARYHLKVDSGMSRIGVRAEEATGLAHELKALPGIRMEGVFTHFATADTPGDWEFDRQLERFRTTLLKLKSERIETGIVSAANSAATILRPEAHFGMVRCGIAVYGLHPAASTYGRIDLVPAMSVKARLTRVQHVAMGEGVSYGFTWHASGPAVVATLPLGYADGVPRLASNRMEVLIGGARCRQVGRVCMDQLMAEVPRGTTPRAGDEAVVVGTQGSERITMDELAEHAETINYELACAFSRRLDRCYRSSRG